MVDSQLVTELDLPFLDTFMVLSLLLTNFLSCLFLFPHILQESGDPWLPILHKILLLYLVNISDHDIFHLLLGLSCVIVFEVDVRKTNLVRIDLFDNLVGYSIDFISFESLQFSWLYSFLNLQLLFDLFCFLFLLHLLQVFNWLLHTLLEHNSFFNFLLSHLFSLQIHLFYQLSSPLITFLVQLILSFIPFDLLNIGLLVFLLHFNIDFLQFRHQPLPLLLQLFRLNRIHLARTDILMHSIPLLISALSRWVANYSVSTGCYLQLRQLCMQILLLQVFKVGTWKLSIRPVG